MTKKPWAKWQKTLFDRMRMTLVMMMVDDPAEQEPGIGEDVHNRLHGNQRLFGYF